MAGAQLKLLGTDSTNTNFDLSLKRRELFSRDNTHGKLLKTNHGTFGTADFTSTYTHNLGESLVASGNKPGNSGLKPDVIATNSENIYSRSV